MKKIILTLLLLNARLLFAQSQFEIIAGGAMDDNGNSFETTSSGDYIISGATFSFGTDRRGLIMKLNSNAELSWAKIYNKSYFFKFTQGFELLDKNYMFGGTVVDTLNNYTDILLMKTDTSGSIIWSKLYCTVGNDYIPALHALIQMPDSGFTVAMGCDTNLTNFEDLAIIRTDKNGDTLWTKYYHAMYRDQASSISPTSDGGFIISGRSNSFGNFIMDMILIKTDSLGNIEWSRRYGGPVWDEATGAIQTSDGGYAVCGSTRSFSVAGEYDCLVFKTDSAGTVEWATAVGDTSDDALYSIIETPDGGLVSTGITESYFNHQQRSNAALDSDTTDIIAFKINTLGDTLWSYVYGSDKIEEAYSISRHTDGGFMIGGLSRSYSGNNSIDVLGIKTDSLGFSCTASRITPVVYHPVLSSDTISFLQFHPIYIRSYTPHVTDVTLADSVLCYQFTSIPKHDIELSFKASPNPFSHSFKIESGNASGFKNCTFKIIDVLGREVSDKFKVLPLDDNITFTRTPSLKTGFYMLLISDANKTSQAIKLLAQ